MIYQSAGGQKTLCQHELANGRLGVLSNAKNRNRGYLFILEIISYALWRRHRFCVGFFGTEDSPVRYTDELSLFKHQFAGRDPNPRVING